LHYGFDLGAQRATQPAATVLRLPKAHPSPDDRILGGRNRSLRCGARVLVSYPNRECKFRFESGVSFCRNAEHAFRCGLHLCAGAASGSFIGVDRMRAIILTPIALWPSASPAQAHGLSFQADHPAWTFDPWIVTPLVTVGAMYLIGAIALRRGHQTSWSWQRLAYVVSWLSLAGALVSPLHWLGERLFSFHMIEHEIIMAISAPLIVLSRPVGTLLWSLPRRFRIKAGRVMRLAAVREAWNWLTTGSTATLLHAIAIWAWHAPALFDAAVTDVVIHRLQHLSFFLTAVLFWWSVFRRSEIGPAAWQVFVTMLHTSALGALMALTPRVLYVAQTATASAWGLTPLEDQQLAGIIMWVPAGTIYAGIALALIAMWIRRSGEKARCADAAGAF
jgi:putative membrane protein